MPNSRKKRQGAGARLASPPLQAQPLAVRNLTLLPVTLGKLAYDASFIEPLRRDVAELVQSFVRSSIDGSSTGSKREEASPAVEMRSNSPFDIFADCWCDRGWDFVHFAYADHRDAQARFCDVISRAFLELLLPLANKLETQASPSQSSQNEPLNAEDITTAAGVVFALYILWDSQIFPQAGVGIAHSRRPMQAIKIESDLVEFLVCLPQRCRTVDPASQTPGQIGRLEADLTYVLQRLCGLFVPTENPWAEQNTPSTQSTEPAAKKRRLQDNTVEQVADGSGRDHRTATVDSRRRGEHGGPVFDVVPSTSQASRSPRTLPSTRIMTRAQADRSFHHLARAVACRPAATPENGCATEEGVRAPARRGGQQGTPTADGAIKRADESRRVLCGLSRADIIRLRARQRLGLDPAAALTGIGEPDDSASGAARPADDEEVDLEFPSWFGYEKHSAGMRSFRDHPSPIGHTNGMASGADGTVEVDTGDDAATVDGESTPLDDLYRLAAQQSKEALSSARQEVEVRTSRISPK